MLRSRLVQLGANQPMQQAMWRWINVSSTRLHGNCMPTIFRIQGRSMQHSILRPRRLGILHSSIWWKMNHQILSLKLCAWIKLSRNQTRQNWISKFARVYLSEMSRLRTRHKKNHYSSLVSKQRARDKTSFKISQRDIFSLHFFRQQKSFWKEEGNRMDTSSLEDDSITPGWVREIG